MILEKIFWAIIFICMLCFFTVLGCRQAKKEEARMDWIRGHCREVDRSYYDGGNYASKWVCYNGEIKWTR